MNIKYAARLAHGISLDRYMARVNEVHQRSGKAKALIFLDMLWSMARYGAGYTDYVLCEFEQLNGKQRDTYLTRVKNKKLSEMLNDSAYTHIFNEKNEFYAYFKDFLGRDFLDLGKCGDEDIKKFIEGKTHIIAKPNEGECGKGIEKIKLGRFQSADECVAYIRDPERRFGVIEDVVVQHEKLNELYPGSVNCIRMLTLVHEGIPYVLYGVIKTGNNGNFVDNYESGGFSCHIDLEKEEISGQGHSAAAYVTDRHPYTGTAFKGFKIPYIKEAAEMVKKAALVVPQVKFIGWDVCITPEGPAIIEGNDYPGDFSQVHDEGRERIGILKKIRDIGVKI